MSTESTSFRFNWIVTPIVFIAIVIWNYGIYITLLLWYLRKFLRFKNLMYISKRYPIVTKCEIITVILCIGCNFTLIVFYRCIDENSTLYKILWNIAIFSQPTTLYGAFYCLLWRCWHFYYDMMLKQHLENQWKVIINPTLKEQKESWFLNKKSSFGSTKFIGKRIFLMYIISCIISIFMWFFDHLVGGIVAYLVDFIVFSVPYSLFFILYRKTPKIGDELHVSDEMKRVNIVVATSLSFYLLLVIISTMLGVHAHIFAIGMCLSSSFWLFCACLIHTQWVLKHVNKWMSHSLDAIKNNASSNHLQFDNLPSRLASFMEDASNILHVNLSSHSQTKSKSKNSDNPLKKKNVTEVLNNEATFNAFVKHLNAEFSLECILSVIEMMQFQHYLVINKDKLRKISRKTTKDTSLDDVDIIYDKVRQEIMENKEMEYKDGTGGTEQKIVSIDDVTITYNNDLCENLNEQLLLIEFNEYVPRSMIVDHDNDKHINLMIAKQKAYDLYSKYIAECSPYEINISYQLRARFIDIMHDYDLWINTIHSIDIDENDEENNNIDDIIGNIDGEKLGSLFNMVLIEMLQLLEFSFSRFKSVLKDKNNELSDVGPKQI